MVIYMPAFPTLMNSGCAELQLLLPADSMALDLHYAIILSLPLLAANGEIARGMAQNHGQRLGKLVG